MTVHRFHKLKSGFICLAAAVVLVFASGCKKDEDKASVPLSHAASDNALIDTLGGSIFTDDNPYEATWIALTEVGDSYVVYNYPNLWNNEETKNPVMIKTQGNQLVLIGYSDPTFIRLFDKVEKMNNDVYFFRVTKEKNLSGKNPSFKDIGDSQIDSVKHSFQWIDKEKHIAAWNIYYHERQRGMWKLGINPDKIYIDSLYNTFPIVDFKWEDGPMEE